MNRDSKGFTLIELVTVIAILGVLAAMTVPKFFALQVKAKVEVENQIVGTIRAGLEVFAADQIVKNGIKKYPESNTVDDLLVSILNPVPANWSFSSGATGTVTHTRTDSIITWTYTSAGGDSYTIGARSAAVVP